MSLFHQPVSEVSWARRDHVMTTSQLLSDWPRARVMKQLLERLRVLGFCVFVLSSIAACCNPIICVEETETFDDKRVQVKQTGAMIISGKQQGTEKDIDYNIYVGPPITSRLPRVAELGAPVDGVFIGVSNFEKAAERQPTPAHALGAATAYTTFLQAANRSDFTAVDTSKAPADVLQSPLKLITDLRLDPTDPSWHGAEAAEVLQSLGINVQSYDDFFGRPEGGLWTYLRTGGSTLTRNGILQEAQDQFRRISGEYQSSQQRKIAVFFLATHGALGPDGTRYVMASDSVANDFRTWISYQELAEIYRDEGQLNKGISVLIVVDTCLIGETEHFTTTSIVPPEGVLILSGAAQGQYSWHWAQTTKIERLRVLEHGWFSDSLKEPSTSTLSSTMSVVPVAIATGLQHAEKYCERNRTKGISLILSATHLAKLVRRILPQEVTEIATQTGENSVQTAELFAGPLTSSQVELDIAYEQESARSNYPNVDELFEIDCDKYMQCMETSKQTLSPDLRHEGLQ